MSLKSLFDLEAKEDKEFDEKEIVTSVFKPIKDYMAKKKEIELEEDAKEELDDFSNPEKYYQEKDFDFCRKQAFLTFPQTKLKIDDLKWWFEGTSNGKSHYPKIKEACYALEHHKDGNLHWHVYLGFSKKVHTKNFRYFDAVSEDRKVQEHPHIQKVYNKYGLIEYMSKEDYEIHTTNLDLEKYKAAVMGKKKYDYFYEKIMKDEMTVDQVVDERPGLFPNIRKLMDAKVCYDSLKKAAKTDCKFTQDFNGLKKRHWWIYGLSDCGKTYFLKHKWLDVYKNDCFQISYDNNLYGYVNQRILWMDEFDGQYNMQFINSLCDGGKKFRVKYSEAIVHEEPLVIICSNHRPDCIYVKEVEKDHNIINTIYNRFRIMYMHWFQDKDGSRKIYEEKDLKPLINYPMLLEKEYKGIDVNALIDLH